MRNRVSYEWDIETVDEHGDIIDHDHRDKVSDFFFDRVKKAMSGKGCELVLVRDEWDECDSLVDRSWAYVTDSKLPECFTYANDRRGAKVPKAKRNEFERMLKQGNEAAPMLKKHFRGL